MFLLNKRFWLTIVKVLGLLFVVAMVWWQIPELRYDLSPKQPVEIRTRGDMSPDQFSRTTFVLVHGRPDFARAFIYQRYGLSYTYFTIEPYGMHLVVRTYEKVTDEWRALNRFLGKLGPFDRQPFSYRVRDIYQERFQVDVPENAFFLALDDVPRLSGWQVGGVIFAGALGLAMFYLFFLFRRGGQRRGLF
jgi:hypothetical protein